MTEKNKKIKEVKKRIILLAFLLFSIFAVGSFNSYKGFMANLASNTALPTPIPIPLKSFLAPILIYHYVEYVKDEGDTIRKSLNIPPHILIKQIQTLQNAGYTFVTPSELISILEGKIKLPQKPVVLSFDDGYRDFYTDVFPILKKYNVKAVSYIVSGFLDKPNYMFTQQLKEIAKSGLVEIGAHTVHHLALRGFDSLLVRTEVFDSKKDLENLIGAPVVSFAYPDGSFDDQAIRIVKEAGFKSAVTTLHGLEINLKNKYSLFRVHPGDKTGPTLLNFLGQK